MNIKCSLPECGKLFEVPKHKSTRKFCSKSCSAVSTNRSRINRYVVVGVNDLATTHPEISKYLLDQSSAKTVSKGSDKVLEWICNDGHTWKRSVTNAVRQGVRCPFCSGHLAIPGLTDFASTHPDIARELRDTTEAIGLKYGSNKILTWVCPEGHQYRTSIDKRTIRGDGCPYCSGSMVEVGVTDLGTLRPDLAAQLVDASLASSLQLNSNVSVEWVCSEGHRYRNFVYNRVNQSSGCPQCISSRTSHPEISLRSYLSEYFEVSAEYETRLDIPFRRRKSLSVDILLFHGSNTWVVEYDGYYFHRTPESYSRDAEKTQILLENGYKVVRIRESSYSGALLPLDISSRNLLQLSCDWKTRNNNELDTVAIQVKDHILREDV